ncbi:hypothetical protein AKJ09_04455 [Labilithrix luteola]|uniref:Uncharacterized protein n=1 Tax=Labilithrix luteola TaxID=1391654 RepID=A0A0K1PWP3_9BACT|nr:hypothetical protein AKJ09_04455 [Labilithrix luteola]
MKMVVSAEHVFTLGASELTAGAIRTPPWLAAGRWSCY